MIIIMKRKLLVIIGFCLLVLIIFYFIFFDYGFVIKINWGISIPYRSFYKEIYQKDSGPSFNGDGTRYHVFSYKNEKYIDEMFEWNKIDEDSNFNHIELMERELDRIMVLEKDRPDYSKCRYWYNFEKNTSDWILDWIIICNNTKENKFYVVEYFL